MSRTLKYGVIMIIMFMMNSCSDESPERFLDTELVPYFERFVEEGAMRGVSVDFDDYHVEGFIQSINENGVVGQCSHSEESPNAVIIDPALWRVASDSKKEQVIFHELGHCFLQRGHLDESSANGECISIMHSSTDICSLNYARKRDYYLDELFNN